MKTRSFSTITRFCLVLACTGMPTIASATPDSMTVDQIVAIAVTIPGFSYWWGGSKWKPGAKDSSGNLDAGTCTPNPGTTGGCPNCTHSGSWGADCSGFVGKAWQIDKPMALDVVYHPYSTQNFVNDSTWWTAISRDTVQKGDGLTYYKSGAGHIFLYEKGDPWGSMWAWECKGCAYGCTYNLRTASTDFVARRRKLLTTASSCTAHCEGNKVIDATCASTDCAASSNICVSDSVGVRCISPLCPAKGTTSICVSGHAQVCVNGVLGAPTSKPCGGAADAGSGDASAADAGSTADFAAQPDALADDSGFADAASADSAVAADAKSDAVFAGGGGNAAHSGCSAAASADFRGYCAAIALFALAARRRRMGTTLRS